MNCCFLVNNNTGDNMKKIVLLIGASSGIGYEIAKQLDKNKYIIYNASRRPCSLSDITNYQVDITNKEDIKFVISKILNKHDSIDIVIYCAGFSMASEFLPSIDEDYRYLFEVNFFGVINMLKEVLPIMIDNNSGRILVISSLASEAIIPYDPFYSASKSALNTLIKDINIEMNQYNIFLSAILPGGIKTNFTYKRKIYPSASQSFHNACKVLEHSEQDGMTVEKAAQTIIKSIPKKHKPIIVIGIKNKIQYFLMKILPSKISNELIRKYFKIYL